MKTLDLAPLRPGRRARWVARRAVYGGGATGLLAALGAGLFAAEAKLARRTIGEPTEHAPDPAGSYGRPRRGVRPLRLAMLGDSSAAGLGVDDAAQTPGALLAGMLARDLDRRVELDLQAVTGARSKDLEIQAQRVLRHPLDVAVILIGANDVTHRVSPEAAAHALGRAIAMLRATDVEVVVGTCPDLGSVKPLMQPLRALARVRSRAMAQAQAVAAVEHGALAVSLGNLLGPEFATNPGMWGPDRFHPSPEGYARVVDALLPSVLEALGVGGTTEVVGDSVQDLDVAAAVAASTPGLEVETLEGGEGAASAGPGRLARLRRRVPIVGRGAPAGPTSPEDLASDEETDER
ncbi:MAG: SGNH/GDSL hydrolase family protein [Frankiaceae bacterium]|nr:SGNH/GDSL hydrolase family protein [Frankiaceae bacterium]